MHRVALPLVAVFVSANWFPRSVVCWCACHRARRGLPSFRNPSVGQSLTHCAHCRKARPAHQEAMTECMGRHAPESVDWPVSHTDCMANCNSAQSTTSLRPMHQQRLHHSGRITITTTCCPSHRRHSTPSCPCLDHRASMPGLPQRSAPTTSNPNITPTPEHMVVPARSCRYTRVQDGCQTPTASRQDRCWHCTRQVTPRSPHDPAKISGSEVVVPVHQQDTAPFVYMLRKVRNT
jgi:hypothetical protein